MSTWRVQLAAVAVLLAVNAPGAAQGAASGAVSAPDRHESRLTAAEQHGEAALRALGADVGIAAQRSGLSIAALRHTLRTDHTSWLDPRGHLFFRDPAPTTGTVGGSTAGVSAPSASYPYQQTFLLHSRPASTHTIYLDFKGGDVSSTAWVPNTGLGMVPAFSLDADRGSWSTSEQDLVQAVWARVSALYAPLNVDVTTENPGIPGLARADASDQTYGTTAMIANDDATTQAVCASCGGLAYVGTYDSIDTSGHLPEYQPAWVLGSRLSNSAAGIADAAAHEVGHNLGLSHDGRNNVYDSGVGGWGPVMGAPYGMGLLQFSDGDYPGATNTEDDYAVIANHGVPLVTDDLPDSAATATPMTVGSGSATASGLITTRADRDAVSFTTGCTGSVQVDLVPTGDHPALDTSLRLLTPTGTELGASDPPMVGTGGFPNASTTGLDAHLTRSLGPGAYVVQVDGTGFANATTSYSDYGSRGGWSLRVTGCVITPSIVAAPSPPLTPAVSWDASAHSATLTWAPPAADGGSAVTKYVVGISGRSDATLDAATHSYTFTTLTGGAAYTFSVTATNAAGAGAPATVTSTAPLMPLSAPRAVAVLGQDPVLPGSEDVSWQPPADLNGHLDPTHYALALTTGATTTTYDAWSATQLTLSELTEGGTYTLSVTAMDELGGPGETSAPVSFTYQTVHTTTTAPTHPRIGRATSGTAGHLSTATARWAAPLHNGGSPLLRYRIKALRLDTAGHVVHTRLFSARADVHTRRLRLQPGHWMFQVAGVNAVGRSAWSALSRQVTAR